MAERLELRALSRPQARRRFSDLEGTGFEAKSDLQPELIELRRIVLTAQSRVVNAGEIAQDRAVGLTLYWALGPERLSMRAAADDSVWRYLSLDVFPDVVRKRNPAAGDDWFWNSRWRIWLKRIWWMTHLSWQGDFASTESALQYWTTDTIAQFVERPGRGFRVALWRSIASATAKRRIDEGHFRRVMKLNTALLATFDPTVVPELVQPYVERLFKATEARR
jgi:hypothetical protein